MFKCAGSHSRHLQRKELKTTEREDSNGSCLSNANVHAYVSVCTCMHVYMYVEGAICNVNSEKKTVASGSSGLNSCTFLNLSSRLLLGKLFTHVDTPPWMSEFSPKTPNSFTTLCCHMILGHSSSYPESLCCQLKSIQVLGNKSLKFT